MTDRANLDALAKHLAEANRSPWASLMEECHISLDQALGTKPFWRRLALAAQEFQPPPTGDRAKLIAELRDVTTSGAWLRDLIARAAAQIEANGQLDEECTANMDEIAALRGDLGRLRAENERLREALKPFAALLDTGSGGYERSPDDHVVRSVGTFGRDYAFITVGDLRRSRAALQTAVTT